MLARRLGTQSAGLVRFLGAARLPPEPRLRVLRKTAHARVVGLQVSSEAAGMRTV